MAKINKRELTRLEIVQQACRCFLEQGYTETPIKAICKELEMSPGNVTFYFPTKEHLLAELVELLCHFQRKLMDEEANEGISSIMALCLELTTMASACETSPVALDFYRCAYTSPLCLEIIRKNDMQRAKEVFRQYRPDWTDDQFAEAEILVSGIEFATLTSVGGAVSLQTRIAGALEQILEIYGVPEELRKQKIERVFQKQYHELGGKVLEAFKTYVEEANEHALQALLKR